MLDLFRANPGGVVVLSFVRLSGQCRSQWSMADLIARDTHEIGL
jgi:hypothetical protein